VNSIIQQDICLYVVCVTYMQVNTSQLNIHPGGRYLFHLMYFYKCYTKLCVEHPQGNITLELKVAAAG